MTSPTQKIPAGYKQTEIGVIPDDWDLLQLKNIAKYRRGSFPQPYGLDKWYDDTFGMPFIQVFDVANNMRLKADTKRKISRTAQPMSVFVKKGSIILTLQGSIGRIAITQYDAYVDRTLLLFENFLVPVDPRYFAYAIFVLFENEKQKAPGGIIKTITKEALSNFLLTLPPVSEQAAIADALSDIDALIEKLEKLIEKKKLIKQGAMQELLTGKRRLPGFSGEWETKPLGDLGVITGSGVDKKVRPEEVPVRLVNFLDVFRKSFIYSKNLHHQVTARPDQLLKCSVKKGDIFFTPSSEMPFDIGISAIAMEDIPDAAYSYHIDRLRLFEDWDLLFRAYIFQTENFSNQTATQCEGSGKRYVLNLATFRERLTIYYPTDNKEQAAIAKILFDMDMEIEKMNSQLAKYQAIKQGMMQVLLTGKIRLINK